jgi:flagellar basal body-associated protein FliL
VYVYIFHLIALVSFQFFMFLFSKTEMETVNNDTEQLIPKCLVTEEPFYLNLASSIQSLMLAIVISE